MADPRRLPAPWVVIEHDESYEVRDASGQSLAYLYFADEPGRQRATRRISREEARRVAAHIARLPEYIARSKGDA